MILCPCCFQAVAYCSFHSRYNIINDIYVVTIRFSFDTDFNLNGKNVIIYTDKQDKFGQGSLGLAIGTIPASELGLKPIFELICTDSINYNFAIDILK